jgi:flagellar hook-associated protein 1
MTIPTFTGYNTALSGLEAAQAALDTTGENISNANTAGYTRQVVNTAESASMQIPARSQYGASTGLGTGVDITSISRIRNQFLDIQYRAQNSATSSASTTATALQQAQTAVNEPSATGLQSQMSQFWSDWSALAGGPTNPAAQQAVVSDGSTLATTLNSMSQQMTTIQTQAGQQLAALTTAPNNQMAQDLGNIATLNSQIITATANGQAPNALLDQRDNLLDNLSGLANITVSADTNNAGGVNVAFSTSPTTPLVDATGAHWPQPVTAQTGGRLGALYNLADTTPGSTTATIQPYLDALDKVAKDVVNTVNAALPPATPFFTGTSASTIAPVTPSTVQSVGAAGAQAVANLSGGTADGDYAAFVGQIGSGVQAAQNTQTTAQAVLTGVSNQRASVSGVSMDEEMTNLINFQQAYQASARVMNAMDTVLNTLINSVGAGL